VARRSAPLKGYKRLAGHKYRTPRGKVITEYEYRSRKARKAGFRNYTQQRKLRESQDFQKIRFDVLSQDADADVGTGGAFERDVAALMKRRTEVAGGGQPGSGHMIGDVGDRFADLLSKMGLPDYWKWRFWYSEVAVG
jgi:type V secretory pathway adhesin AidA